MTAAERVAKGAALLDERRPGWAVLVDVGLLDRLGAVNVLAQLWHDSRYLAPYVAASDELGTHGRNHELGFVRDGVDGVEYPELNAAWRDEVARRRTPEAPAADDDSTCGCEETT